MIYPVNHISISNGYHTGKSLDFGWWKNEYKGQDIISCDAGVVYKIEKQSKGGNVIYIKHNNGWVSCYAHLDTIVVKVNQSVLIGQKIGTMGTSGGVSMHLHFGIYSNGSLIYKNSDIDPFEYCKVYPNQDVRDKTQQEYGNRLKYYEDKQTWEKGRYQLIYNKALRKSHKLGNNIWKVKECSTVVQKLLTSKNKNANAYLTKGYIADITEIYDENGRIWGKWGNDNKHQDWIVLCNIDGTPQTKRV